MTPGLQHYTVEYTDANSRCFPNMTPKLALSKTWENSAFQAQKAVVSSSMHFSFSKIRTWHNEPTSHVHALHMLDQYDDKLYANNMVLNINSYNTHSYNNRYPPFLWGIFHNYILENLLIHLYLYSDKTGKKIDHNIISLLVNDFLCGKVQIP